MYKYVQNSPVVLEPVFKNIHKLEDSVESEPKRFKLQPQQPTTMSSQQQFNQSHMSSQQQFNQSHMSNSSTGSSTTMYHDTTKGTFTPLTTTNSYDGLYHKMTAVSMIDEQHFTKDQQQLRQLSQIESKQQLITITSSNFDCPCGHLHGPGQGHHEDIGAVGFADFPLLRGPD